MSSLNPRLDAQTAARPSPPSVDALFDGLRAGDRVLLSRAITLVESTRPGHRARARALVERCLPHAGRSVRVGVTGVPGVGKSTFIEALGTRLTGRGRRLAVLAVDPSSERSRGAILGDKTRMEQLAADARAYIRPSATGGSLGGVTRATRQSILLCEAAGYDTVFVETVGVGQAETTVHSMVDFFLLLALAGAGDELQGIKRGVVEMADALVITKADTGNEEKAEAARAAYERALRLLPPAASGWAPRVMTCSALTGAGLDAVWSAVEDYHAHAQASGFFEKKRRRQARYWMRQTIEHRLREDFFSDPAVQEALGAVEADVLAGRLGAAAAAERLLRIHQRGPADG